MKTLRWLRIVIIAYWAVGILGVILGIVLQSRLPEALRQWNRAAVEAESTFLGNLTMVIGGIAFLAAVVGSIALFNRRRWGARTFLLAIVVGTLALFGSDAEVAHPIAESVFEVHLVFEGLIIGLAFFSTALQPDDGLPEDLEETFS